MLPEDVLDKLGQRLEVGDRIAVAFRWDNTAELRIGTIIGHGYKRGYNGILLEIEWESQDKWGTTPVKSKIETHHKRFVKINTTKDERK